MAIVLRDGGEPTIYLTDAGGLPLDEEIAVDGLAGTGCVGSARFGRAEPISGGAGG